MGGGGRGGSSTSAGVHFAPFQPDSEDHLRNFAVSAEERRQMEEDYRLALAMQKGEAAAAAAASSGPGKLRGSPYRVCVCVCVCVLLASTALCVIRHGFIGLIYLPHQRQTNTASSAQLTPRA